MFLLAWLSKSNFFSLVSHLCRSCSNCVVPVSHLCRSCLTRVARVCHSCCKLLCCGAVLWHRGAVVTTTAQLHSTKPELRLCGGSNPASGVSEICDDENLWQWSRLEIRLHAFRRSNIPQNNSSSSSSN